MIRWLVLAVTVSGCAPDEDACMPLSVGPIDPAGEHHQYIVDFIDVPATNDEVSDLGFDLNNDAQGRPDNALGWALAALLAITGQEATVDAEIQARIDGGELIQLIDIQTTSITDATDVGITAHLGSDFDGNPDDNWPGPERYGLRVIGEPMSGEVRAGVVYGELGRVPLELVLPNVADPIRLDLHATRIEAELDGDRLIGRLGGAVLETEARAAYVPGLYLAVAFLLERDCPGGDCVEDSLGQTVMAVFDENEDGEVTFDEVETSGIVSALFSADLDMFDSEGRLAPRCDGRNESMSIAVGFTAVPAVW